MMIIIKELKTLIHARRICRLDTGMGLGKEKCAILEMKSGK